MLGAGSLGVTDSAHLGSRLQRLERTTLGLTAFFAGRFMAGNATLYPHLFRGNGTMNVSRLKQFFVAASSEACCCRLHLNNLQGGKEEYTSD